MKTISLQTIKRLAMELKIYPAAALRKCAPPLRQVTGAELSRLNGMLELMYEQQGVGLAGPQVGWNVRVLTMDVEGKKEGERIFINPAILETEGVDMAEEGCLSLPGLKAVVARAGRVVVAAYTVRGERVELEAEGLAARAWQHEIDHLNGVLFIDKLSGPAGLALRRRLKSLRDGPEAGSKAPRAEEW